MRNEGQENEEEPSPSPVSAAAPIDTRGPGPGKHIPMCLGRGKDGFARGISAMIDVAEQRRVPRSERMRQSPTSAWDHSPPQGAAAPVPHQVPTSGGPCP
ncbi:hypothetical protein AV530_015197 [Patagioenas fasciata monilis]|uniref:Uncharacterized protein n=1 Tax=Patagioenas fasciata monilis TaxID=372326 RepID=A0A1V4K1C6_PATFA|nr:hypothetical protein AV530_015197 [Patagioenas fasciata monilis]